MPKLTLKLKPTFTNPSQPQSALAGSAINKSPATIPDALATFDQLPDSAHVRLPIVAPLVSASPATVWRWVRAGRLPAPKKLGPNITAWNVGDLRRAMAAMQEA